MEDLSRGENNSKKGGKKALRIVLIIVALVASHGALLYLGNKLAINGVIFKGAPQKAIEDLSSVGDTSKYKYLFTLRDLIYSKYDGDIDDQKLLEGAMKGMASAVQDPYTVYMTQEEFDTFMESSQGSFYGIGAQLGVRLLEGAMKGMASAVQDPYTVYMTQEEFDTFMESSQGSFYGIGAQLGVRDNKVTIIAPIEGSPAEEAGLKSGDVILKVDDYEVVDLNTEAVVSRVRGEEGQPVTLTIQRDGGEPFEVKIVRAEIKNESVKGEMLDDSTAYVQITTFSDEEVSQKFTDEINELKAQGMKKLILDLRGNPGGYLDQCVEIASHFIKEGEIVTYTIDKYDQKVVSKSKGGDLLGIPLVVLVDGGSASASEVVTGALRDHQAATIIGTNTFGKGIVQQLISLPDNEGGLKVTTSKYYTPNGENIHGTGIAPEITVEIPQEVLEAEYSRDIDPQFQKALEIIREK